MSEKAPKPASGWRTALLKYLPIILIFTVLIFLFSVFMQLVAFNREETADSSYQEVSKLYSGELKQAAPSLNVIGRESANYYLYGKDTTKAIYFKNNANLVSTTGNVLINAEFVKKGLIYQPTYRTEFTAEYTLENKLAEESVIAFEFPFPANTSEREISNAKLKINGEEQTNAKAKIGSVPGLRWEGKIPARTSVKVGVSYNTVGLSKFSYEGFENNKGAQDFDFVVKIMGTRQYDVVSGLSVDSREFGDEATTLKWEKDSLYSRPAINISVGDKLNPASQVSRVYSTMTPLYLLFSIGIIFLAYRFGKQMKVVDVMLMSILFALFFPFFHYVSSFTIDPTVEIFSRMNVGEFSMPLYVAFAIALGVFLTIVMYLLWQTQTKRFALRIGLPVFLLIWGYFPLVATIPEYFGLLSLIGLVLLSVLVIQIRLNLERNKVELQG